MRQTTSVLGVNVIAFTILDAPALRNKPCVVTVTIDGAKVAEYTGSFPPSGGLTVQTKHRLTASKTVRVDTTVDGSVISAARDGLLNLLSAL